jgi:hypothetical protein
MQQWVPGSSRPKGWTANRLPTSQPPLPMHSKSFTGSSAASIDVSDVTKDTNKALQLADSISIDVTTTRMCPVTVAVWGGRRQRRV